MFVKIPSSAGRQYVKLVESFRDGGTPRQRVIATLGRIEAVRAGESNACWRPPKTDHLSACVPTEN